jgi:hypothetical protein
MCEVCRKRLTVAEIGRLYKSHGVDWKWWLMPVIPFIQEQEIRRTAVQGWPRKKVHETPISTKKSWVW